MKKSLYRTAYALFAFAGINGAGVLLNLHMFSFVERGSGAWVMHFVFFFANAVVTGLSLCAGLDQLLKEARSGERT